MSSYGRARVTGVERWNPGALMAGLVLDDGSEGKGLVFEGLSGGVEVGDEVVVNTTAVELELGSGGFHFVLWNLSRSSLDTGARGHIMKLRYTPMQLNVAAVEEELGGFPVSELGAALAGMPVIAGSLHSQLLPAALAYAHARPGGRLVYVMTDGGCLPYAFSRTAHFLRSRGLLERSITCGHAFGGDLEAVNIHGALLASKLVCGADAAVVVMGPGIVGTGSALGFTGMEQGDIANAAASIGGRPVVIPRITFADPRDRHRGLSHHTVSALRHGALSRCVVPVPLMDRAKQELVDGQLGEAGITGIHEVRTIDAAEVLGMLEQCEQKATVMGRTVAEEPEFFMAAGAAGLVAAGIGGEG